MKYVYKLLKEPPQVVAEFHFPHSCEVSMYTGDCGELSNRQFGFTAKHEIIDGILKNFIDFTLPDAPDYVLTAKHGHILDSGGDDYLNVQLKENYYCKMIRDFENEVDILYIYAKEKLFYIIQER